MILCPILRLGKCPVCKKKYRWEESEGLKLTDARCQDCDEPLIKTQNSSVTGAEIVDVEADWIRGGKS